MGSSLSCGCDKQPYFPSSATAADSSNAGSAGPKIPVPLGLSSSIPPPTAPFKFYAELFQLSTDCSQWILLYPRLLSISIFELSTKRPSILFFASSRSHLIFHQVIDLPSEVKRVSPCFAYWRYSSDIFGVNIVRSKDCDKFCQLFIAPSGASATAASASMQHCGGQFTSSSSKSIENSPPSCPQSITIDNATVRHSPSPSTNCILEIRLRPTSIRIGDAMIPLSLVGAKIEIGADRRCAVCNQQQELKVINCDTDFETEKCINNLHSRMEPSNHTNVKNIPRIRIDKEPIYYNEGEENPLTKPKERAKYGKPPLRMHRSLHAQTTTEFYENDLSDMPSTSWQQPQICQDKRARSAERSLTQPEITLTHKNKGWSAPLRNANHKLNRRDPALLPHLAFEKLNNKDERRKSMPNAVLQISHFSDMARGQLISSINELVTTEELYVKHLQKLINQYLRPSNLPILELTEQLLRVQSSFLSSLLDAAGDTVQGTEVSEQQLRDALIRIFALFVNRCSKFKIYSEYSAAFLRFQQERKEKWKTIWELEKMNSSKEQSEGVQSLLIRPIQRVLKYPLFLQQMRDNSSKGSVERQQGEQALQRMQALAEYINEMQRLIEQYGKEIEDIAAKNSSASQMKFSQLLMFAHVDWLNCSEKGATSCVAFVFTSVVLVLCPHHPKNKAKFYRILPIAEVEITESVDDVGESRYSFTLVHTTSLHNQAFQLCCCQADVKTQFIKAIQKASTLTKKDQRRPLSGSSQSDGGYGSEKHH